MPGGDRQPCPSCTATPRPRFPSPCAPLPALRFPRRGRASSPGHGNDRQPRGTGNPKRGTAEIGPELPQLPGLSRCFPDGRTEISTATHSPSPLSPEGPGQPLLGTGMSPSLLGDGNKQGKQSGCFLGVSVWFCFRFFVGSALLL